MKKQILFVGIICMLTSVTHAQIRVNSNGDLLIGDNYNGVVYHDTGDIIITADGPENALTFYDVANQQTSMRIFKQNNIGYFTRSVSTSGGLSMSMATGNVAIGNATPSSTYKFSVYGPTYCTSGLWTQSDRRLKTNIKQFNNIPNAFDSLVPYTYNYKIQKKEIKGNDRDGFQEIITDSIDTHISRGFIAQDVQKYFPELVIQGEDSLLAVNYDGFIPILWQSYKEMLHTIADLDARITQLEHGNGNGNGHLKSETIETTPIESSIVVQSVLHQNYPNPWNTSTEILMELDSKVINAMLCIYDMTGKQIKCYTITSRGETQISIHAEELQPGMYMYSLIADGMLIDSKQMVLTE